MNKLLIFLIFITLADFSISQDSSFAPPPNFHVDLKVAVPYKKYFFEGVDFIKENKQLVVIVKDPQTQFAREFRPKLYEDTAFLAAIQRDYYSIVDPNSVEIIEMCGYDVFFYVKSGRNLKLLKEINSNCGSGRSGCSFLDVLDKNGTPLKVDTIRELDYLNNDSHYFIDSNFIYGSFVTLEGKSELWQDCELENRDLNLSEVYNNCSFRPSMYEGKFSLNLKTDTTKTVTQNLMDFFASYGIDSLAFRNINFEVEDEFDLIYSDFLSPPVYPKRQELSVIVHIGKEYFDTFREFEIVERKQPEKKVHMLRQDYPLLIIHR